SIVSEALNSGYEDVEEELLSGESAKEDPAESYDDVITAGQISDEEVAGDYDDVITADQSSAVVTEDMTDNYDDAVTGPNSNIMLMDTPESYDDVITDEQDVGGFQVISESRLELPYPLVTVTLQCLQSLWGRGGEACSAAELNGLCAGQREMDSCVALILLFSTIPLSTAVSVRLVDGGSRCAGRVEVYRNGQWGTVCRYDWDMTDATVVCRELDCGEGQDILQFGPGSGPILMGLVWCRGSESTLNKCRFPLDYDEICKSHDLDIGVTCSGEKPRLIDGSHLCSGRVEILLNNNWTTVCDADFDQQDAEVVCRQLGCGLPVEVLGAAAFGRGEGQVWSGEFQCRGNESQIHSCPTSPSLKHNCSHDSDVGLTCSGHTGARLVNGLDSCSGRVEIQYLSEWGTVCDVSWDMRAASVLCGQLKCGSAVAVVGSDWFGEGSGRIWADVFDCQGNETHLSHCPISSWSRAACSHKQDAGVICNGSSLALHEGRVQLSGGMECEGKVEVYFRQDWWRVLLDSWSETEASVVCRQLGCGSVLGFSSSSPSSPEHRHMCVTGFNCSGSEAHLRNCSSVHAVNCSSREQLSITCSGKFNSAHSSIRLVGSGGDCAGRLEVFHSGTWGTVTDDLWDIEDAQVVCKQLQCGVALSAPVPAQFGPGTGPIWLNEVECEGDETSLWNCRFQLCGEDECGHKDDVGVVCSEYKEIRLTEGCEGNLEVFYNGTWGNVCLNGIDEETVSLICQELNCGRSGKKLSYHVLRSRLKCSSSSQRECSDHLPLRLSGGDGSCSGRLEVYHNAEWGSVCDDLWDIWDAQVVCRQLDCGSALSADGSSVFGAGSGPVWLNRVKCRGNEIHLWDCPHSLKNHTDCSHRQHAGVTCTVGQPKNRTAPSPQTLPPAVPSIYPVSLLVLGVLLFLTLVLLVVLLYQNRRLRRVLSRRNKTLTEAVYEEIDRRYVTNRNDSNQRGSILSEAQHSGYENVDEELLSEDVGEIYDDVITADQSSAVVTEDTDNYDDAVITDVEDTPENYDDVITDEQDVGGVKGEWLILLYYDDVEEEEPQTEMNHVTERPQPVSFLRKLQTNFFKRRKCWCSSADNTATHQMTIYRLMEVSTERTYLLPNGDLFIDRWPVIIPPGLPHSLVDPPVCLGPFDAVVTGEEDLIFSEEILDLLEAVPGILSLAQEMGFSYLQSLWGRGGEACSAAELNRLCAGQREMDSCVVLILLSSTITLSTAVSVRLVNGDSRCAGRVEVYRDEQWGTVCDNDIWNEWDMTDAGVVCRELGCGEARGIPKFGPGSGPILMGLVECDGSESALNSCDFPSNYRDDCSSHDQDVGVTCAAHRKPRLTGGPHLCSGRVEVLHGETWYTVCDADFDQQDAEVVCRELGCGLPVEVLGAAAFGRAEGQVWKEKLQCRGNESEITLCEISSSVRRNCQHDKDVGLICSGARLVNGVDSCSGRVELQYLSEWGTVCDVSWDMRAASVLCGQLKCGSAVAVVGSDWFGEGSGRIWADVFDCQGNETHLSQCPISSWSRTACSHQQDAGVICNGSSLAFNEGRVRLSGECEGKVEVYFMEDWNRVLLDSWSGSVASVACRQLGCGSVFSFSRSSSSSTEHSRMCVTGFNCSGSEAHLRNCSSAQVVNCSSREQLSITCSAIRLAGSGGDCAGRLEVFHSGSWGTVCDDLWDIKDAQVVCRQLQCGFALSAPVPAQFGRGTGPIWLNEVECEGNETSLWNCSFQMCGENECGHKEDVGVVCSEYKEIRLSEGCEGNLEVFYNGTWGNVCENGMAEETVSLICQELNCGRSGNGRNAKARLGSAPNWLDNLKCDKYHSTLWHCPSSPWGQNSCDKNSEVARITCSGRQYLSYRYGELTTCSSHMLFISPPAAVLKSPASQAEWRKGKLLWETGGVS
ncbi:hypothetical protein NFI96_022667, partial [Prochilodus magdalenae]